MKKILSTLFFTLLFSAAFSQSFEGKITYNVTYKSKNPAITDAQFAAMMGSTQEYFIKGGSYKSIMNGELVQWQLYPSQDTLMYSKMSNTPSVYWVDARTDDDQILKTEINKGAATILGYLCDELILTCKSGVQKYYFSQKLPLDYTLFAKHNYGNWLAYLKQAKAVPLKMSADTEMMTIESTATAVKAMKLESSFFQLAKGSKLEKMPY